MKTILIAFFLFPLVAFSQNWKIASTALEGKKYPQVNTDGSVHFKVYFPNAKAVVLDGGDALKNVQSTSIMSKDGYWDITTSPVEVGFHYYWFNVDGVRTNDPNTHLYFGYNQPTSGIEIPSGEDFFVRKNVPHGTIINDSLYSNITQGKRYFKVYLPPNYSQGKFPVLYLYHGTGEDITGWEKQGKIENILDNLYAEKKAKKYIVVMDYGVALNPEQEKMPDNYPRTVLSTKNLDYIVTQELIPFIEKKYRTNKRKAIAGLSRGSYQAMLIGVNHTDIFDAIGSFSPVIYEGTNSDPFKELPIAKLLNGSKKPLFFIGIGAKESPLFFGFNATLDSFFKENKYPYTEYKSPGTYHEWLTWRRCLYQFMQKLN